MRVVCVVVWVGVWSVWVVGCVVGCVVCVRRCVCRWGGGVVWSGGVGVMKWWFVVVWLHSVSDVSCVRTLCYTGVCH